MSFGPCESRPVKTQLKKKTMNAYLFIEWMKITVVGFLGLSGYIFEHFRHALFHPETTSCVSSCLPLRSNIQHVEVGRCDLLMNLSRGEVRQCVRVPRFVLTSAKPVNANGQYHHA